MDLTKASQKQLASVRRKYGVSVSAGVEAQPTFITHRGQATIFLGTDWIAGCELARVLKRQGYAVTYRVRPRRECDGGRVEGARVISFLH